MPAADAMLQSPLKEVDADEVHPVHTVFAAPLKPERLQEIREAREATEKGGALQELR